MARVEVIVKPLFATIPSPEARSEDLDKADPC